MPRLILSLLFILTITTTAYAGWVGPSTVVSGGWGDSESAFGIYEGDMGYFFPKEFFVTEHDEIIVPDRINRRIKVYRNSQMDVVLPKGLTGKDQRRSWPDENLIVVTRNSIIDLIHKQIYDFKGDVIGSFDVGNKRYEGVSLDGSLLFEDREIDRYYKYSSAGELLKTYNDYPLDLGRFSEDFAGSEKGKYKVKVQYEDITYRFHTNALWTQYFRDKKGFLYFYNTYTVVDSISGMKTRTSSVIKYDQSGRSVSQFDFPISEFEPPTEQQLNAPTTSLIVRNDYGSPVIGPDGSIYTWKRTPDTYSILKWTWVDEPDIASIDFTKPIPQETISSLDKKSLRLLRNTIFARHGRQFKSNDLKQYFTGKNWYKPSDNYSDTMLSEIDKANLELITKFEAK